MSAPARPQAGRRATSPEARLRRQLFGVLTWLEQQQTSGVATVSCDGEPIGDLLVSRGRVCIAIPARTSAAIQGQAMDASLAALIARAQAAGGFSTTAARTRREALEPARRGLLQLVAADLVHMLGGTGGGALGATLRVAADDYDRGLAFAPVELCAAALASKLGPLGGIAAELTRTLDCSALVVLARASEAGEFPYPVAARGLDQASLRDVFRLGRCAFELCAAEAKGGRPADPRVVTLTEGCGVWHFVGAERRLVAVRADGPYAGACLRDAIAIATAA